LFTFPDLFLYVMDYLPSVGEHKCRTCFFPQSITTTVILFLVYNIILRYNYQYIRILISNSDI